MGKTDDGEITWTLRSCADALSPLLDSEFGKPLTPHQLDAIEYLLSIASDDDGDDDLPRILRHAKAKFKSSRFNKKLEKTIAKAFQATEEGDDEESTHGMSESMSDTYQCVLDVFGGHLVLHNAVEVRTKNNDKKFIRLKRGARPSGNRMNLLIDQYRTIGNRKLLLASFDKNSCLDFSGGLDVGSQNCPPEWNALSKEAKVKLASLLSWEKLSSWDFNIVEVAELTCHPLLFVGWSILCANSAQEAMEFSVNGKTSKTISEGKTSYNFQELFAVNPRTICNFLREVERRYKRENPYHNNIHAADVTQTTHCLFQLMGDDLRGRIYDPITVFSLILGATFHDIAHPGTNNLFQQNAMTPLAIQYNDVSILENMHSAVGHSILFGEEKKTEWDVFVDWEHSQKVQARNTMKDGILATDMSQHFAHLAELDALIRKVQELDKSIAVSKIDTKTYDYGRFMPSEEVKCSNESKPILSMIAQQLESGDASDECNQLAEFIPKFLMHAADISNPAKKEELALYWADCALAEFFAQGDKEREMGLPISPLCDRETVKRHDSQMGFIKFVIQPTFELLGEIIPKVKTDVVPIVGNNLGYWMREKSESEK